ncbi:hypothetical protein ACFQ1S_20980 [Kibdelosporangium lantanae]|uniref:Uncharacterized protein n=1 Tax=Kibdelosporangium lantanae TaxID=1497396 RepID=A0ABW3MC05_9PSEU
MRQLAGGSLNLDQLRDQFGCRLTARAVVPVVVQGLVLGQPVHRVLELVDQLVQAIRGATEGAQDAVDLRGVLERVAVLRRVVHIPDQARDGVGRVDHRVGFVRPVVRPVAFDDVFDVFSLCHDLSISVDQYLRKY